MKMVQHIWALILFLFLITMGSCDEDEDTVKYSGVAILSSEKTQNGDIYIVYGFSFEKGKSVPYTLTGGSPPDVIVNNLTDVLNNIIGAVLNSPDNEEAFCLSIAVENYADAKDWFDNYNEVTATDFIALSDTVKLYQVWTLQTAGGKFAKILIKQIDIITSGPIDDYIEITVDYAYQPDGTRIFRSNRTGG